MVGAGDKDQQTPTTSLKYKAGETMMDEKLTPVHQSSVCDDLGLRGVCHTRPGSINCLLRSVANHMIQVLSSYLCPSCQLTTQFKGKVVLGLLPAALICT